MIDGDNTSQVCSERVGSISAIVHVEVEGGVSLTAMIDDRAVLERVPLGPIVSGVAYGAVSSVVGVARRAIRESFTAASGKAIGPHEADHAEAVLTLAEADGTRWELVLRVAANGVALRYRLPLLDGVAAMEGERTSLDLANVERLWALEYQTWYETPRFGTDAAALAPGHYGLPMLMRTEAGDHVLVTESGIDGRFTGSHLEAQGGRLQFVSADASVEVTRGEVSPWRVFVLGSLADIVESQLVDELAPDPAPGTDFSWVRPGRAAWSWWSDFYSGAQLEHQMRFVDDAAQLGWEHLLIDCGWDATWVPEIVSYASRRGIQVHLWTVWRDLNGPENLRRLALWRSWGVAGIKVDFMESESRDRYRWYDALLAEAARVGLMVNVHGSVIPRGWARTWPHLIGYEAARGAEYYVFYDEAMAPEHNVILPFTRNVVGAMDYTPVALSAPNRLTSDAHELALAVAYECGITHFADDTAQYTSRPLVARFLAELAPSWDETLLLAGDPDSHAVIARRSGERWFIGVIATGEARSIRVPLERLGLGPADAWVVGDGLTESTHASIDSFEVDAAANGGAVAIVTHAGRTPFRAAPRPVLESPVGEPAVAELAPDRTATLTVSPDSTLRVPPGWRAERAGGDRWIVHAGSQSAGVVTVERPGEDGVAVVSHARVLPPLAPGDHAVSGLPFLAFRNESGPVERGTSNGGGNPGDGTIMTIAGETYADGVGMSAPGWLRLHLGGRATAFSALVGIDDETTTGWEVFGGTRSVESATARVAVVVDGVERAHLDLVSGGAAASITADLIGGTTLELRVSSPGEAHVDWAHALITVGHR
ncbi:MAG: hypothetical protein JWP85_1504 [Rhodoglobus sp.]|nr:hypothetical protein [Rhodoglobus sp.]